MGRQVGVADESADPEPAVSRRLDLVEAEAVHVDQVGRRLDLELHEIEQIGPAAMNLAPGVRACLAASTGEEARS